MSFQEIWTRGLGPKEKEAFENALKYSEVIKKLQTILDQFESEAQPKMSDYEKPAWPYFRADLDGYLRAINKIRKLLTDQKETK